MKDYEGMNRRRDLFLKPSTFIEIPDERDTVTIGDRIRFKREERDWSQRDLAKKSGISNACISRCESGKAKPGMDVIIQLCKVFKVSSDWLLGLSEIE